MKWTCREIFNLQRKYESHMQDSFDCGKKINEFINLNKQTDEVQGLDEKEVLTFNFLLMHLTMFKSQAKELQYGVSLTPYSKNDCKTKEIEAFQSIFKHLMLDKDNISSFQKSLDKALDFGHSIYHIKPSYENNTTLNQILKIECLEDPRTAFFDYNSKCPDFSDSVFCGRKYKLPVDYFNEIYPNEKKSVKGDVNIIDFWYKVRKKGRFLKLDTGVYKREDLILPIVDHVVPNQKAKTGHYYKLNYIRCCEDVEEFLEKKDNINCPYLPLVFNPCNHIFDFEKEKFYYRPFAWYAKDSQILINSTGATLWNIIKNVQADKYFINHENIDKSNKNKLENINNLQGAFAVKDIQGIRREPPQPLPEGLVDFFLQTPTFMKGILGSFFEGNSAQIKATSGIALDKMFDRSDLMQNDTIEKHLCSVEQVGKVLQFMIPIYYTEERRLDIKCKAGKIEEVIINERMEQPNGQIIINNNVNRIISITKYHITLTPSPRMKNKNMVKELENLYSLVPQFANLSLDKYLLATEIPHANVLAKRAELSIPPIVMSYANGQITYQEAQSEQQKQQQQQQQMAMQQQQPQQHYLQAKAFGEQEKAKTAQYGAETARMKMQTESQTGQVKVASDHQKWKAEDQVATNQQNLEYFKAINERMNALNDMMEKMKLEKMKR